MTGQILLCAGAALPFVWAASHLFATKSVVRGFGDLSTDNKRIITMEWVVEGVALIFIAAIVLAVTLIDRKSGVSRAVYWICLAALNTLSVVSLMTGFQIRFLPFKLCPVIFTGASILILLGMYL